MTTSTACRLSAIFVYPIKSCAGLSMPSWEVSRKGLRFDRQWMLVDADNNFLSQRKHPKMALVAPELTGQGMVLTAPGMSPLALPLQLEEGDTLQVSIWRDTCQAVAAGKQVDQWFEAFLGVHCRLVCQPESAHRQVDTDYAQLGDLTYFSDGFPLLLASEASLHALNVEMQLQLSMARFRPNLVVTGCAPYAEDTWRRIAIGDIGLRLPKPCSRCNVPTIDPATGAIDGAEPLRTLSRLRKSGNHVYFGQNAIHEQCGQLHVGDPVWVHETGAPQPLLVS